MNKMSSREVIQFVDEMTALSDGANWLGPTTSVERNTSVAPRSGASATLNNILKYYLRLK